MPSEFSRTARVSEQLRRELAPLVQRLAGDAHLGLVSITAVDVSPDLKHAQVYVSQLGAEDRREELMDLLGQASGRMRGRLGRVLRLRRVPQVQFRFDASVVQAARLCALIDQERAVDEDANGGAGA